MTGVKKSAIEMIAQCMRYQRGNDPRLGPDYWACRTGPDAQLPASGEVLRDTADHGRDDYHRLIPDPPLDTTWG